MDSSGILTIQDLIFKGNQDPDHPAIESPSLEPLTYAALRQQVTSVVETLNAKGFERNDRIAVIVPAGPDAAVCIVSVMAGFTALPLNPQYREQEFSEYFSLFRIRAAIIQKDLETAARAVAVSRNIPVLDLIPSARTAGQFRLNPEDGLCRGSAVFAAPPDTVTLLLTSGTTSTPKIVPYSQELLCNIIRVYAETLKITPADRNLHIVPYFHALGLILTLLPLYAGGTLICTQGFIPPDFLELLKKNRPSFYWGVPALHKSILHEMRKVQRQKLSGNSLRFIGTVSAFMPDEVRRELEMLSGVPLIEVYGMTEAAYISLNVPYKPGSVGIPVIESLIIMNDDGAAAGPGERGEIVIQGKIVISGYENESEENRELFRNGWFHTGDMGYLDDEGYLFITGRKKELINKGGEKISPEEIDRVLMSHPLVREAMTFGVKDPALGEEVAAMVVPSDDTVTEAHLRQFLLDRLAPFKVPRKIFFVGKIPRNPAGKPLRHEGTNTYS